MIPIGDDKLKNAPFPFINWILIIVNILVFLYELSLGDSLQAFIVDYGAVPQHIMNGNHLYTALTSMFLHGGVLHVLGNMLFLWIFGDNIEAALGHFTYLIFYLLGGLVAEGAHILSQPGSGIPTVGASGAIAACLGAYIIMYPRSRIHVLIPLFVIFTTIRVSAWVFLGVWILIQVVSGTNSAYGNPESGNIAWWAHIGGFIYGVLCGIIFYRKAKLLRVPG
jgi:membrane associated rhomboid family serine protease